ncbi:MAG: LacI family DNA-binding transcriptional regulator [Bacillota bacterium]
MATIKDIARKANVSDATVSRVINNSPNVKPQTREKVLQAIEEFNFYPNSLARGMRSKKTNSIGLLLADITNPFYAETAKSIIEQADKYGYSIILCTTNNDLHEQQKYIEILLQRKVDGFIFASVHWKDPSLRTVVNSDVPFVLYNRKTSASASLNYVVLDNELGSYLAVEHLYNLGHRRIAMIRGPHTFSTGRERSHGYYKALKDFGLPLDESLVVQGKYSEKQSFDSAMKLLNADNPPTAIFASNDLMALSAYDAAMASGLSVPQDIALVGFDDIDIAAHRAIQLTTVSQNLNIMAEIAFNSLRKMIIAEPLHALVQVVLKPNLTIRKTCGYHLKKNKI